MDHDRHKQRVFVGSGDPADSSERWNISGNPADFSSGANAFLFCTGDNACSQHSGVSGVNIPTANVWAKCLTAVGGSATPNLAADGCFVSGNSVITPPNDGSFGNIGRNIFRDSGFKNVDFSVFKTFAYKERYTAQFRVEIFNLFNHPIAANPYGSANGYGVGNDPSNGSGFFGCGCQTADVAAGSPGVAAGGARGMQLGLKLAF